ncbi:hypothetical protein MASR1M42_22250 [Azonexus hydrophilus]
MDRLASAPCAINAFSRVVARLQKHAGYGGCILLGVTPEIVIADVAVLAAAVDHQTTRSACREMPKKMQKAARIANQLCDLLEEIQHTYLDAGLKGEQGGALIAAIPEAVARCGDVAELAYAAANEVPSRILPEQDWPVAMRKWSGTAAFVAFADDRIKREANLNHLPYGFQLTAPEMAGLAWAVTGQDDLTPVINTTETEDYRAGRVRGIREERKVKSAAFSDKE